MHRIFNTNFQQDVGATFTLKFFEPPYNFISMDSCGFAHRNVNNDLDRHSKESLSSFTFFILPSSRAALSPAQNRVQGGPKIKPQPRYQKSY